MNNFEQSLSSSSSSTDTFHSLNISAEPVSYTIGGVPVTFPTKAYPSQLAMMSKVIHGIKTRQNCLLESPTGSGKSLALLCAALAWQRHERDLISKFETSISSPLNKRKKNESATSATSMTTTSTTTTTTTHDDDLDDMEDFQPRNIKAYSKLENKDVNLNKSDEIDPSVKSVPKIFFATRTHKQISQITQELQKTHYKNVRSIILASRDHTCVNPKVTTGKANKNEACKELLDNNNYAGGGCSYYDNSKKYGNFKMLNNLHIPTAYDLEDLVTAARRVHACPYYISRQLVINDDADIIFCPYSYLIDPTIRSNASQKMAINLDNQIVIFDEAHNIEGACRDACSMELYQHDILVGINDFEKIAQTGKSEHHAHKIIAKFLTTLITWINSHTNTLEKYGVDTLGKHWTGTSVITEFDGAGLGKSIVKESRNYFEIILKNRDEELARNNSSQVFVISASTNCFIKKNNNNNGHQRLWKPVVSLNVWCLNPAVAFKGIQDVVHSIVLTSGTLSPTQSFESELNCQFPLKMEAFHVITSRQILPAMVSVGPNNVKLNGAYVSVEKTEYQYDLGLLILDVCTHMKHGILCFFSSYRLLEKITKRWQSTELWGKLNRVKHVLVEPRSGAQELEIVINQFYKGNDTIAAQGVKTGSIFLAVCRGKVSEGLNFADNHARAVICIGIPFPAFKDLKVELKQNYNNANKVRGLVSGGDWYEIQAFRALNQALGRCIGHRHDWGAIILVDERFILTPRYTLSLPKWIRNSVQHYKSWDLFIQGLIRFQNSMTVPPCSTVTPQTFNATASMPIFPTHIIKNPKTNW